MGLPDMPFDYRDYSIDETLSGLYMDKPQAEESEELPQGPSLKGKKQPALLQKTGERQVAKKIACIAENLKTGQPTLHTKSLLAQVQDLKKVQSEQTVTSGVKKGSEIAIATQITKGFTGIKGLQSGSFDPVKPIKHTFSSSHAFYSELSKKTTVSVQKVLQEQPLVFRSAVDLHTCLQKYLSPYPFAPYLTEKGIVPEMSLYFADRTYADVKELNTTIALKLVSLNISHLHLDKNTLMGIGKVLESGLLKCVRPGEERLDALQTAERQPVSLHLPSETKTPPASRSGVDAENMALQVRQHAVEAFTPLTFVQHRVKKISNKIEDGTQIGKLEEESESSYVCRAVDMGVNIGALAAAEVVGGVVGPIVLVGINQGAKVADYAMPSVDAFLEIFPAEDPQKELERCLIGLEYCPPRYYGLAAKGVFKAVQDASDGMNDALTAVSEPIKKALGCDNGS